MSLEAVVLLGRDGEPLHWHIPPDRLAVLIPDSRPFWDVIWEKRDLVGGTAHSHPGRGVPAMSEEDRTTWKSTEGALGRRLTWWITSEDSLMMARWDERSGSYGQHEYPTIFPSWLPALRAVSFYGAPARSAGSAVFSALADCHPRDLSVADLARRAGLSRAAARRGAAMLAHGGLVRVLGKDREEKRVCLRI